MRHVVHIGMHKTGSTAFQARLAWHGEALLRQGVDFPVLGANTGAKRHFTLMTHFGAMPAPHIAAALATAPTGVQRRILSCEGFCRLPAEAIARMVAALGPDTFAIAVLRDPGAHIVSLYKQHLRGTAGTRSLEAFVASHTRQLRDDPLAYYGYDAMAARWRTAMRDLVLLPYRRDHLVADLTAATAIVLPDETGDESGDNRSLGDLGACLMSRIAVLNLAGRITAERREALWLDLVADDRRLVGLFAGTIERRAVSFDNFFAAFGHASPRIVEQFGFRPPAAPLDWPHAIALDDDAVLARLDAAGGQD